MGLGLIGKEGEGQRYGERDTNLNQISLQSKQEVDDGKEKAVTLLHFKSQTETLPQRAVQPSV